MGSFSKYPKQCSIATRWLRENTVRELDYLSAFSLNYTEAVMSFYTTKTAFLYKVFLSGSTRAFKSSIMYFIRAK